MKSKTYLDYTKRKRVSNTPPRKTAQSIGGTANPAITKKTAMGASKSPVAKNSIKPRVNSTKAKTGASKSSAKRYIEF